MESTTGSGNGTAGQEDPAQPTEFGTPAGGDGRTGDSRPVHPKAAGETDPDLADDPTVAGDAPTGQPTSDPNP